MNRFLLITIVLAVLFIMLVSFKVIKPKEETDLEPESNMSKDYISHAKTAGTANFKQSEFDCHDGTPVPEKYRGNLQILMNNLEVIRKHFGNKPIKINSGYRTPAYNASIPAAVKGSKHQYALAADIVISGYTPKQVADGIISLINAGKIYNGGVGRYGTFTHYDIAEARRWGDN